MHRLYVQPSRIQGAGNGVFTQDFVPKGDPIAEYTGAIKNGQQLVDNGFIFKVKHDTFIDPSNDDSCLIKYANDANGPCRLKCVSNNAKWHIIGDRVFVLAKRDIKPHEEIFIEYGRSYWAVTVKK